MSTHDVDRATDLSGRYGDPRRRRWIAIAIAVVVVGSSLGWLAWATWYHSTPEVTSELGPWDLVDPHTVTAVVEVNIEPGAEDVSCRVEAQAEENHAVVGVLAFEPVDGRNEITITTERQATAVDLVGCTAEGQSRPH